MVGSPEAWNRRHDSWNLAHITTSSGLSTAACSGSSSPPVVLRMPHTLRRTAFAKPPVHCLTSPFTAAAFPA